MEAFAILFAIALVLLSIAASVALAVATGAWAGFVFFGILVLLYRVFSHETGPVRRLRREELSAFQQPLAEDDG